jgi:Zn-dependent alcohol dehydrogenase
VGSKHDLEDMYAAVAATRMRFDDIIDARFDFKKADEAIEHVWQGKQIGKVVVDLD